VTVRITDATVDRLMLDSTIVIATLVILASVSVTNPFRSFGSALCGGIKGFRQVMCDAALSEAEPDGMVPEVPSGHRS